MRLALFLSLLCARSLAADGTDVVITHQGLPQGVSAADNETGTRMALGKLAALVGPGSSS